MASSSHVVQDEVMAAARAEVARTGATGFAPATVVARFMGRGASRATLYRWVGRALAGERTSARPRPVVPPSVAPAPAPASVPLTPAPVPDPAELLRAFVAELECAAPGLIAGVLRRLEGQAVQACLRP